MSRGKTECYCINSRRASEAVSGFYDRELAPLSITVNQYSLLKNIGRLELCSVSELAEFVGLERTSVVRMIRPLEERGLIEDTPAGEGPKGRRRNLRLTREGRETMEQGYRLWAQAQQKLTDKLGKDKLSFLLKTLFELEEACK